MKGSARVRGMMHAAVILLSFASAPGQVADTCSGEKQSQYFAVEISGVLCGYSADTYCYEIKPGRTIRNESSDVFLKMKLLGAEMNGGFRFRSSVNTFTGRAEKLDITVINGESVNQFNTEIRGDTAYFSSPTSGVEKTVPLGKDVIITSLMWYEHLVKDFSRNDTRVRMYKVYDPLKGEIAAKEYRMLNEEVLVLNDKKYNTLVFEENDLPTGLKTRLWLDRKDGYNVRTSVANRNIYLSDRSVTSRLTIADLDNELFFTVGKPIPDFEKLSAMKVKARINSYGDRLTPEALSGPGQKFTGTINGSLIDGTFETSSMRYAGRAAPPFPPDFSKSEGLGKYLANDVMIESDEPEIKSKALEITSGSSNSWDAAVKLAAWVAGNIAGELPGGISAINTLRTGGAECGGHSRLMAAFCRAVGIPARVVVGCMFTNYFSGGFGQHAWTEVYMGENGWIALDATIGENDYIDAGHIRLGENATFRPVSMELLDYSLSPEKAGNGMHAEQELMLGSYMNVEMYRMFKIVEKPGGIAIDIPGRFVLDLNEPDGEGRYFPVLTREIGLKPADIRDGKAGKILMNQYFRLTKIVTNDTISAELPEEFRQYAGTYRFSPARLSLDVMFSDGVITTQDPLGRSTERIAYTKSGEKWIDKSDGYEIAFIGSNDNKITALNLTVRMEFLRGEPVTNAIEKVISESGVEAGLRKYDEIRESGDSYYFFSEHMLHQIGHTLQKENRMDDAILVFLKNTQEYPDSFMANDAMAEILMKAGDNKRALEYFKKAVLLKPDYEYGKRMIEELKQKNN